VRPPGTAAAEEFAEHLGTNGMNVVGRELEVMGPLGKRRYDIVVRDSAGRYHGIEVKTGGASPTAYQDFTDRFVNLFGAQGTGRLSGVTVESTSTVFLP
jgi:filamentous hemagglutinin